MKNLKKIGAIVLAMVMALALMVPAMAAGTGTDGTITITNATIDETYFIYKIFSATYSGNNASYTIKSGDAWYELVNGVDSPFALTQINGSEEYNVAVKEGKGDADVLAWLNGIATLPAADASKKADAVTVEFDVSYGYYLVKSTLNGGGTLTVDNATPNATVIDKNQEPGNLVKTATSGVTFTGEGENQTKSAQIGDVVDFEITYTATNYDGDEKIVEYYVDDDMPDGFDLVAGSIAVKVGDKDLTLDADYTIAYGTEDTDDFKVTIPWVGADEGKTSLYDSPNTITVTYKATMNANAVIDGAGNTNTATITHKNDGKDTPETPDPKKDTDTETVYTYALAIKKVDKNGEPLKGATFTLKQGEVEVKVSSENGVYTVDPNGTATIVSPADGLIIIKGVKGVEYTLTETEAPTGYNKLTTPVTVTPVKTGETTTTVTKYLDENGEVIKTEETSETDVIVNISDVAATVMVVVNFTGNQLPSTGGIGTTIFYIVGGILVASAAILLVTRKRVSDEG